MTAMGAGKELMRAQAAQLMAAINARDFDAAGELPLEPESEFRSIIAASEGATYRGIEGLRQWARDVDAVWEDFRIETLELVPAGDDCAVLVMHLTGTARASGVPLDSTIGQVWHWREGRLWLNEAYADPRDAFAAAGIGPLPP